MAASSSSSSNMGTFEFILLFFVVIVLIAGMTYLSMYMKAKAVDQVAHEHHERKMREEAAGTA